MRFYTTKEIIDWTTTLPFMLKEDSELLKSLKSIKGEFYPGFKFTDINYSYNQHKYLNSFSFLVSHEFLEYARREYDSSSGEEYFEYEFTVPGLALREIIISLERKNFLDTLKGLMNAGFDTN